MCEKPMAVTVAECQGMIDAAKKSDRKLMIAYRAQYEPFNLAAIQLSQNGKLGKLKSIVSDHGRNLDPKEPSDRWRVDNYQPTTINKKGKKICRIPVLKK